MYALSLFTHVQMTSVGAEIAQQLQSLRYIQLISYPAMQYTLYAHVFWCQLAIFRTTFPIPLHYTGVLQIETHMMCVVPQYREGGAEFEVYLTHSSETLLYCTL